MPPGYSRVMRSPQQYIYLGNKLTDPVYRNRRCIAVLRPDGKCIRGKNGNMLVNFNGRTVVVAARQLRKVGRDTSLA